MNRELIYDVGMNTGDDTAYYLNRGYRVVAIEANPDLVDLPARWQTFEEMKRTFAHFQQLQRDGVATPFWNEKGYSFWADFHASRAPRR